MAIQRNEYKDSMDHLIGRSMKAWVESGTPDSDVRSQLLARAAAGRRVPVQRKPRFSFLSFLQPVLSNSQLDLLEAIRMLRVPGGVGYEYKRRSLCAANRTQERNFLPISSMVFVFS